MPSIAVSRNDRTRPLTDGRVPLGTLPWEFVDGPIETLFSRAFADAPYELTEISFSNHLLAVAEGRARYQALPIATSRSFRHSAVYVRSDAGIESPADLRGRRVGLREFTNTASLAARGMLDDEYGVKATELLWLVGDIDGVERERVPLPVIDGLEIQSVVGTTLSDLLLDGELDAIIAYHPPAIFGTDPRIRRLFPHYPDAERDYFARTGIFPVMHLLAVRSDAVDVIGRDELLAVGRAFDAAKRMSYAELLDQQALKVMLPWGPAAAQETIDLMGRDYWGYGLRRLRTTLETQIRWARVQGIVKSDVSVEEFVVSWPELEAVLDPS
jgi:4,5-dihydroxyphthalate decarboxylase